jgi:hypothetical protein
VARKLAVLLHRLWLTGEEYEPLHNVHMQNKETLAIAANGLQTRDRICSKSSGHAKRIHPLPNLGDCENGTGGETRYRPEESSPTF